MREVAIACGGLPHKLKNASKYLELDLSPRADAMKRIRFDPQLMCAPLLDDFPDALADALEIAAYLYSADRLVRRISDKSPQIESGWPRRLCFRIPVRCHQLWTRNNVPPLLIEALSFLSGDEFDFEFCSADRPSEGQLHLGFNDAAAQNIRPDKVILFSGGLDSLAGVAEAVIGSDQRAVLVTHQSANSIVARQNRLAAEIESRTSKGQTFYAPIWVRRAVNDPPVEHSQRLRSFLFASLGIGYAHMFGCSSVQFYENGVTSFNLPIGEQVVGTRASRTTHPRVLARFGQLFSLLLDKEVSFDNPFLWKTKTEVVKTIADNSLVDLIGLTTSCANIREFSVSGQQCGTCSQCVERQYAMLATGHRETPGTYACDLFTGAHEHGRGLTMVQLHLLRAQKLSTMSEVGFLSSYGEVYRASSDLPMSRDEATRCIHELHQRYGSGIVAVADAELARHATLDSILQLPPTSLLALLRSPRIEPQRFEDPAEREVPDLLAVPAVKAVLPVPLTFAIDQHKKRVVFPKGITLTGKSGSLLIRLAAQYGVDRSENLSKATYVSPKTLCREFDCTDVVLRQRVTALRRKLTQEFEIKTGYTLDAEDVIQSRQWTGYRLNPHLIMVDVEQLERAEISRLPEENLTTVRKKTADPGAATA